MPAGKYNDSQSTAVKMKQYAANAGVRNLVADSPDGATCARKIKLLGGSGSFTSAKDQADALIEAPTPGTLGPLQQGEELTGTFSSVISEDQAFIAFW